MYATCGGYALNKTITDNKLQYLTLKYLKTSLTHRTLLVHSSTESTSCKDEQPLAYCRVLQTCVFLLHFFIHFLNAKKAT